MKHSVLFVAVAVSVLGGSFAWGQSPQANRKPYSGSALPDMDPASRAIFIEQGAREQQARVLREQAKEAIRKGEIANAFLLLQQALGNDPTEGEANILLTYFYIHKGQPEGVIATLDPIVNPRGNVSISVGKDITARMIYILALLDRHSWGEAVTCYERTWSPAASKLRPNSVPPHTWSLPQGGPSHEWPNPQFSRDIPDYAGLRAQAHLVLGSRSPMYMEDKDRYPYMLEHLSQVLSIHPNSLDATFLSGWMLGKMDRFDEARSAYASASKLGSPAIQKEINEQFKDLKSMESTKKAYDAQQAAKQAKLK